MQTMVCIGDSLTQGADIPVGHAWPSLVANALRMQVINRGIGGDTTLGMLGRFYAQVVAEKPEFVFIMGGTNDLWWGSEIHLLLSNLFSLVFQARHNDIVPVIGIPLPVATEKARSSDFSPPWEGYDRMTEKLNALAQKLSFHAQESEVALVDLHGPFFDDQSRIRTDLFLPDGLHPNRDGHLVIAQTINAGFACQLNFPSHAPN